MPTTVASYKCGAPDPGNSATPAAVLLAMVTRKQVPNNANIGMPLRAAYGNVPSDAPVAPEAPALRRTTSPGQHLGSPPQNMGAASHKGRRGSGRKTRGKDKNVAETLGNPPVHLTLADSFQAHGHNKIPGKSPGWDEAQHSMDLTDEFFPFTKLAGTGPENVIDLGNATGMSASMNQEQEVGSKELLAALNRAETSQSKDKMTEQERTAVFEAMSGKVVDMAFDAHGCRLVQRSLEVLENSQQVELVNELKGHVTQALDSAHGNHVLQRMIELMRPTDVGFILKELDHAHTSSFLAKHRYGCRVLERLIEHFPRAQLVCFLDDVINLARPLCVDCFGNFVIQHVLEHGSDDQKRRIVTVLQENLEEIATDTHACSVLDKALSYTDYQQELATGILETDGLLADMAAQRGGFAATQRLFKVFQGSDLEKAKRQLKLHQDGLMSVKHGKMLLQTVAPEMIQDSEAPPARIRSNLAAAQSGSARQAPERRRHGRGNGSWPT